MGCGSSTAAVAPDFAAQALNEKPVRRRSFGSGADEKTQHVQRLLESAEAEGAKLAHAESPFGPRYCARMVVLGTAAVGKTTLVRSIIHQCERLGGGSWRGRSAADAVLVGAHLFYLLREVLNAMARLNQSIEEPSLAARAWEMTKLPMLDTHSELVRYADDLARICSEPSVVDVLERAEEAQLSCHTRWFLSQQQRILSPGYSPSVQDMLRLRVRTTGVARHQVRQRQLTCLLLCLFAPPVPCAPPPYKPTPPLPRALLTAQLQKHERQFEVIDVGGMRAERRKWAPMLQDVDCVCLVVSLSEWSLFLEEDRSVNRMEESLSVYETNAKQLREAGVSTW